MSEDTQKGFIPIGLELSKNTPIQPLRMEKIMKNDITSRPKMLLMTKALFVVKIMPKTYHLPTSSGTHPYSTSKN